MSWKSGSELASTLWNLVRRHIPDAERESLANRFIGEFNRRDACISFMDCETLCKDAGMTDDDE